MCYTTQEGPVDNVVNNTIGTEDSDSEQDGLPILPPPCWNTGGDFATAASVVFPFNANHATNGLRFIQSSHHDYGSSDDESRVNCNVQ